MHHSIFADKQRILVSHDVSHSFYFGNFFVNEKKVKSVVIKNSGDLVLTLSGKDSQASTSSYSQKLTHVKKGDSVSIDIIYLPLNLHKLIDNKCSMKIVFGP